MNIPCDNMFLLVLYIMTLMTFDHFLKKIDIGDTFWKKKWSRAHIYKYGHFSWQNLSTGIKISYFSLT